MDESKTNEWLGEFGVSNSAPNLCHYSEKDVFLCPKREQTQFVQKLLKVNKNSRKM